MSQSQGVAMTDRSQDVVSSDPPSPELLLALVEGQQRRTEHLTTPDPRVMYGTWGVVWFAGHLLLFLGGLADPLLPLSAALAVFFGMLVVGNAVVGVELVRAFHGLRGDSRRFGILYGLTWPIGMTAVSLVVVAAGAHGLPDPLAGMLFATLPAVLTGVLLMAGAALWDSRVDFGLGCWFAVLGTASAFTSPPTTNLLLSLLGGGVLLVAALVAALRRSGRPRGEG